MEKSDNYIEREKLIAFLDNLQYTEEGEFIENQKVSISWLLNILSDNNRF